MDWGIEALTTRAPALAEQAGYAAIGEGLDGEALATAGHEVAGWIDALGDFEALLSIATYAYELLAKGLKSAR